MKGIIETVKAHVAPRDFYSRHFAKAVDGREWVSVACPWHDDARPSLRVNATDGQFRCMACGARGGDIIAFVAKVNGLSQREAAERIARDYGLPSDGNGRRRATYPTPDAAFAAIARRVGGQLAGSWTYHHADGSEALRVGRFNLPGGDKTFRPIHRTDAGYVEGDPPGPMPLYGLAELGDAKRVFIVEGEKCADAGRSIGLTATTSAHGSQAARKTDWRPLAGRECVLLPDADEPGLGYAEAVADILSRLDPPARVKLVELPGLPPGGDIADFIEARECQDSDDIRAGIEALAEAAECLVSRFPLGRNEKRDICLAVTPVSKLLAEPVEAVPWLVDGLLSRGGLSILAGKPKAGKSTLARCVGLDVAAGRSALGRATIGGPVLYLAHEERRAEVAEHFRRMGAAAEVLYVHTGAAPADTAAAVEQLRDLIREHGAVLTIIDTMLRFLRVRDVADYAEMLASVDPLLNLSRETDCHTMLVYHARKTEGAGLDSILGSVAIAGACDTGLVLKRRADGLRVIESVQRYGMDMPETVLVLDPETGRVTPGGTVADRERAEVEEAVADALAGGAMTEPDIRETVGGNTGLVGKVLREMVKAGRVRRDGKGRAGDPYRYSLAGSEADAVENIQNELA